MQEGMKFYAVKLSPDEEHIIDIFRIVLIDIT